MTYHDDFDAKSMISVPLEREFREETISYYQVGAIFSGMDYTVL